MTEHGWVICAPGDPNEAQLIAIISTAGGLPFCMQRFNADTGAVDVVVNRAWGEARFIVDRSGVAQRVCRLTMRRTRYGWSMFHDGELVASTDNPMLHFHYVASALQRGPQ